MKVVVIITITVVCSLILGVGVYFVFDVNSTTAQENLKQQREDLIGFIWKGNDGKIPTRLPDSVEFGISDKNFGNLQNLKKIDRITVEMKYGVNSIAYLLHPTEQTHNDLIIYHNGHGDYLHDGEKQIRFFLDRGYSVLVFSMPLTGMNSEPTITIDNKEIKFKETAIGSTK